MEILFELPATDGERLVLSWLLPYSGSRDQQACGPWLLSTQVPRGGQGSTMSSARGPRIPDQLRTNAVIRIVDLVATVSPDRKPIRRLALPVTSAKAPY
jgi:hypothetical protein